MIELSSPVRRLFDRARAGGRRRRARLLAGDRGSVAQGNKVSQPTSGEEVALSWLTTLLA